MMKRLFGPILVLALAGFGLSASAEEIAAKVNGSAVTVAQVDAAMPQLPPDADLEIVAEIRNSVLNRLINDQLVIDKAIEMKLDQDLGLTDPLDRAERSRLGSVYVERVTKDVVPPTDAEIRAFYDRNAEWFSSNKRYAIRQLGFEIPEKDAAAFRQQIAGTASIPQLSEWLSQKGISPVQKNNEVDSAVLPKPLADRLDRMKVGGLVREVGDDRALLTEVISVKPSPLSLEAVRPALEREMTAQRRRAVIEDQVRRMRDSAKVEYMTGYAKPKSPEETKAMLERIDKPKASGAGR